MRREVHANINKINPFGHGGNGSKRKKGREK